MAQAPVQNASSRLESGKPRGQMDDVSLTSGRNGALAGAVVGLLLGVTVWENWLVVVIVLSFYGALLGAVVGVGVGLVNRRG